MTNQIHSPQNISIKEFEKHQGILLPYTSQHLGPRNLDIGCGNGITSLIHNQKLGIKPTLTDVVDIRHPLAQIFPFYLLKNTDLPFENSSFDSSYLQYVLHHTDSVETMKALLKEAFRISKKVIIIEETRGDNTNLEQAEQFDTKVNAILHPGIHMPIHKYYSKDELVSLIQELHHHIVFEKVVSEGNEQNGYLETYILVAE